MKARSLLFCVLAMAAMFSARESIAATVVFTTDFNSGLPPEFSGAGGVESVASYPAPFGGDYLRNRTGGAPTGGGPAGSPTILTLTGLPPHTSIDLKFLLAVIDSWDSSNGSPAPDWFNVVVDGVEVFEGTWANKSGTVNTVADFGFAEYAGNPSHPDRAVDLGTVGALTGIAHTASTVEIRFFADGFGWQGDAFGGEDESWAIDNVEVSVNDDPVQIQASTWGRLKTIYR